MKFTPPPGFTKWPPVEQWTELEWSCWLSQHHWTTEQIAQYLDHDRFFYGVGFTAAGARAFPHNAYETGVTWLYKPTPKGVTLHATRAADTPNNILWGGSAGGTKSMSALWEVIGECLFTERDDYRAIISRRELEELRRTHLDRIDIAADRINRLLGWKESQGIKVTSQPPLAVFHSTGAKVIMAHCLNAGDQRKYLSEAYDIYVGDEATEMLWEHIVGIQSRVRNDTKINRVGRMILTTNPGGPSHDQLVRYFIKKDITFAENEKYVAADYLMIQARLHDNPFYMDADGTYTTYETRLWMHDTARRNQLLDGDWDTIVGQFFTGYDPTLHVRAIA